MWFEMIAIIFRKYENVGRGWRWRRKQVLEGEDEFQRKKLRIEYHTMCVVSACVPLLAP